MTGNFPPFRAAPPKGEARKTEMQKALEADGEKLRQLTGEDHGPYFPNEPDGMKELASELDKLLTLEAPANQTVAEFSDNAIDVPSEEAQHVEHVRCCAKCFSTEVVDAVKIGDAIYIKVS